MVEVYASEVPVFRGRLGVAEGNYAIKIQEWLGKRKGQNLQQLLNGQGQPGSSA
jgi:flagellar motor switch protein FliM